MLSQFISLGVVTRKLAGGTEKSDYRMSSTVKESVLWQEQVVSEV